MKIVEAHDEETIDAITRDTAAFQNYVKDLKKKVAEDNLILFGVHNGTSFVGRCCLVLRPEEEEVRRKLPGVPALVALQVNRSEHRNGIGTKLTEAIVAKAKELGKSQISLGVEATNTVARTMYEELGFIYEGSTYQACWDEPDSKGGLKRVCVEALLMVKELI